MMRDMSGTFERPGQDSQFRLLPCDCGSWDVEDHFLRAWMGGRLIAIVDTSAVISAHISEKG